jgi:hypothetical protein
MSQQRSQGGAGQLVPLAVTAIVLVVGYVALDMYSGGQKDMLSVEARGMQMISALATYRRQNGSYPDALDKLVPKYAPAVSKCPDGEPMAYVLASNEYVLSCRKVVFKQRPYSYDSRSKAWNG